MIGRTMWAALAAVALGATLTISVVAAPIPCSPRKDLTAGCKNEITACKTSRLAECEGLTGRERRLCRRNAAKCKREIKVECKADNTVCTGSPSGAFLD